MIVLINLIFGAYDIGDLILIFLGYASMNLFGRLMKEINQFKEKTDQKPFTFGTIAGLALWIAFTGVMKS